jgi:molybdopterin-guanine dinucleotide biosynthesis protein B
MNIFAIVGHSESGKTRLISQLIPDLKGRGYTVAVIKHCPHGFELETEFITLTLTKKDKK